MQRELFDLLRRQQTATAADLAAIMLERFGLDASDKATAYAMRQRAIQAFKRCERRGLVRHVGGAGEGGRFKVWMLIVNNAQHRACPRGRSSLP